MPKSKTTKISARTFNPFWSASVANENKYKEPLKKAGALIFKFFKICIYLFLTVVGLWGCTQIFAEPWVGTNPTLGTGLEIGFNYGTTGDFRYDLQSSGGAPFFAFSNWSLNFGPFYAFFVWPASQIVLQLMYAARTPLTFGTPELGFNTILSIFILLLIIRIITMSITLNSIFATERMTEIQGKVAEINAKYKNRKDPASKRAKQLETMRLYKKHKIKSSAIFVQMFVTLPIFLIVFRVVSTLRPIKATILFTIWDLSKTPTSELFSNFTNGGWIYIFFLVIVIPVQFVAQKLPQVWAQKRNRNARAQSLKGAEQLKKTRRIQLIFSVVIAFITAFSVAGVGLYWFMNSFFTIAQSYITHLLIMKRRQRVQGSSKLDKIVHREV
ncbi:membrane protein insertase YidC [[Mycoplasma] testudinis]|uniref:membrane protein insertase YidC n=1 Tax=[Mycoplasma] testudinis TaxID=33924 RepID=UPI000562331D|nr:membrane protein insertase YidC [[Mycoplasma] testudinis]